MVGPSSASSDNIDLALLNVNPNGAWVTHASVDAQWGESDAPSRSGNSRQCSRSQLPTGGGGMTDAHKRKMAPRPSRQGQPMTREGSSRSRDKATPDTAAGRKMIYSVAYQRTPMGCSQREHKMHPNYGRRNAKNKKINKKCDHWLVRILNASTVLSNRSKMDFQQIDFLGFQYVL